MVVIVQYCRHSPTLNLTRNGSKILRHRKHHLFGSHKILKYRVHHRFGCMLFYHSRVNAKGWRNPSTPCSHGNMMSGRKVSISINLTFSFHAMYALISVRPSDRTTLVEIDLILSSDSYPPGRFSHILEYARGQLGHNREQNTYLAMVLSEIVGT